MQKQQNNNTNLQSDFFETVESYKFLNNVHDTALNSMMGTYGHQIITHNLYNKSYDIADYHYHDYYDEVLHADNQNRPQVVNTPVDYDNRSISDYNEVSRVSVDSTSNYLHDIDLPNKPQTMNIDEQQEYLYKIRLSNNYKITISCEPIIFTISM